MNGEKGEMKGKNIQLKIVKLPHEIDTVKSYHEVLNYEPVICNSVYYIYM